MGVTIDQLRNDVVGKLGIVFRSPEFKWVYYVADDQTLMDINAFLDTNTVDDIVSPEAKAFGNVIIDSGVDNTLVIAFPFVKYPPNSNYATLYPKLTEYLKKSIAKY